MLAGMLKQDESHFLVQTASKPIRWDDEWAFCGHEALRDTEAILRDADRFGCVEVSYGAPRGPGDPLLALDTQIEIILEARHVERLRKQFAQAGLDDLSDEEVKYLWLNYDSVEEFAA